MVTAIVAKPVNEAEIDLDKRPIIGEEIFYPAHYWVEDDKNLPRGAVLDMQHDCYVWGFTGPRGSGKTSFMSYKAEQLAVLYDKRIVSNYPIAFTVRRKDGTLRPIESEPLDIGKLLMFDADYRDCILVMDEAPQIINRLATMTWKNRLLDLFLQQIRKNHNSFFYASQNESIDHGWVDASLRFQTDILAFCRDASRRYPQAGYKKGGMILVNLLDKSGQWTGYPYMERPRMFRHRVLTELIWNSFDTNFQLDVWESLRKVKVDLNPYQIGDKQEDTDNSFMERVYDVAQMATNQGKMKRADFYRACGDDLTDRQKKHIGHRLVACGVSLGGHDGDRLDFANFNMEKFRGG